MAVSLTEDTATPKTVSPWHPSPDNHHSARPFSLPKLIELL
jgi:hypothetical protein